MANFTPKKVTGEKGKAKGSLATPTADVQSPPQLYLGHHHLEKLGITKMPPVGAKIKISGMAHVGSTSENQDNTDGGPQRSMTLHLHKMDIGKDGPGQEVDQEAQSKQGAKAEMDKALKRGAGSEAE